MSEAPWWPWAASAGREAGNKGRRSEDRGAGGWAGPAAGPQGRRPGHHATSVPRHLEKNALPREGGGGSRLPRSSDWAGDPLRPRPRCLMVCAFTALTSPPQDAPGGLGHRLALEGTRWSRAPPDEVANVPARSIHLSCPPRALPLGSGGRWGAVLTVASDGGDQAGDGMALAGGYGDGHREKS